MALNTTASNFKGFTFDTYNSKNYGVYLTGAGVYNAPVRAVEMVSIPGRNGAFALDQGRFENIEVTYHASIVADNETDFANGIANFRNAICSKVGYQRLEDEYNPDEYRMAVYKSGLDVTPKMLRTGEFDIVFDCKPQRFLKSGETAVSVANNGTISNPTYFDAKPVLQVWGYGEIDINGEPLKINSEALGEVNLYTGHDLNPDLYYEFNLNNTNLLNNGDTITADFELLTNIRYAQGYTPNLVQRIQYSYFDYADGVIMPGYNRIIISTNLTVTFTAGTSATKPNPYAEAYFSLRCYDGSLTHDAELKIRLYLQYSSANKRIVATPSLVWSGDQTGITNTTQEYDDVIITGDSTQSALGQPIYFDLDIGEAYKIENNNLIEVNNAVTIPSELPTLKPGTNTITYDNTVTQFKIVPRWYKV